MENKKNIHLSKEEMNAIIKEEIDNFKKEIKDAKEKDQFAYKFSKVFTEALEVPEYKAKLVETSVYNLLKEYTSKNNGGITYTFDQTTYDKLYRGIYLIDNALEDILERDIISKDSLDARWLEEGVLEIKEVLRNIQSIQVNESINENVINLYENDIIINFTKEELKHLKYAPPKEYAQQYVKLLLNRANIPGKIINSMQFPELKSSNSEIKHRAVTKVLYIDTRDNSEHFCDVTWITPLDGKNASNNGEDIFRSKKSASISLPNSPDSLKNIKLFGLLDAENEINQSQNLDKKI